MTSLYLAIILRVMTATYLRLCRSIICDDSFRIVSQFRIRYFTPSRRQFSPNLPDIPANQAVAVGWHVDTSLGQNRKSFTPKITLRIKIVTKIFIFA